MIGPDIVHERYASFSTCMTYRYRLWRQWGDPLQRLMMIMLNPSTADSVNDDPTIRRCIGFAHAWGFGALDVCNLFAYRATNPKALYTLTRDVAVGPRNDAFLVETANRSTKVVFAWGAHGTLLGRAGEVVSLIRKETKTKFVHVIAWTKEGHPVHPLYQKKLATTLKLDINQAFPSFGL